MPEPSHLYLRGGTFYARIQVNGRDRRVSLRTADRKVARKRLRKIVEEAEERRAGVEAPAAHSWEEACLRWHDLQLGSLRPGTQRRYLTSLKQLDPHFAGRDVAGITASDVHAFSAARIRSGINPATVRRDLTVMSRVMRMARRAGWCATNPVPDEMEEIEERRESIRPVPIHLLARLVRRAPPGFRELIRFLARTGCRQEEAASLEWSQLNLRAQPATCTFSHTKTRSPRVIELGSQLVRDLAHLARSAASPFVFRSPEGTRYKNVAGRFRVLLRKAVPVAVPASVPTRGRKRPTARVSTQAFRCHDLRHTFAIRALQKGMPIYQLARHLGHSTVKTTEAYASWLARPPE